MVRGATGMRAGPRSAGNHADRGRKVYEGIDAKTMTIGAVRTALDFGWFTVCAAFMARNTDCRRPEFVDLQRHLNGSRFALARTAEGLRRPSPLQG